MDLQGLFKNFEYDNQNLEYDYYVPEMEVKEEESYSQSNNELSNVMAQILGKDEEEIHWLYVYNPAKFQQVL